MTKEEVREFRNRVLFDVLGMGDRIKAPVVWSTHAKQRLTELVAQGFSAHDAAACIETGGAKTYWSEKYGCPLRRFGELSLAFTVTDSAEVLVVTALPATRRAWEKVYQSGLRSEGREPREQMFAAA